MGHKKLALLGVDVLNLRESEELHVRSDTNHLLVELCIRELFGFSLILDIVGEFEFFRPPEYYLTNNSKGHLLNAWNYLKTFARY